MDEYTWVYFCTFFKGQENGAERKKSLLLRLWTQSNQLVLMQRIRKQSFTSLLPLDLRIGPEVYVVKTEASEILITGEANLIKSFLLRLDGQSSIKNLKQK